MNQSPVILFDGVCNLCCEWTRFLIWKDKKMLFKFASIQSEVGERLLNSAGLNNKELKTIIYLKNNQVYLASTAVLEILTDLGGIWKMFSLFQLIPKAVRDRIYLFIAERRYRIFGKRSSCLLPTPENQKRFLL
jgi:predicted DCC family thiol-disulfide oxidoreductase YuxK